MIQATFFKPTKTKVLVEPLWPNPQVGHIHIPVAFREDWPPEATVVALGAKVPPSLGLGVGDRVYTEASAGQWMMVNDRKYRLIDAKDVLARLE